MKCRIISLAIIFICIASSSLARNIANTDSFIVDTVFNYTLGIDSIPKAFKEKIKAFKQADSIQTIFIEEAYLFKHEIFVPVIKPSKKIRPNIEDECFYSFTNLNEKLCATSGCITGIGAGACAGMLRKNSTAKKLRIKLIVHTYKPQ